jgi:hypothetical protein
MLQPGAIAQAEFPADGGSEISHAPDLAPAPRGRLPHAPSAACRDCGAAR